MKRLWYAVDLDGMIKLFKTQPVRMGNKWVGDAVGEFAGDSDLIPGMSWENESIEIVIHCKKC